jgi:hypothetical protein
MSRVWYKVRIGPLHLTMVGTSAIGRRQAFEQAARRCRQRRRFARRDQFQPLTDWNDCGLSYGDQGASPCSSSDHTSASTITCRRPGRMFATRCSLPGPAPDQRTCASFLVSAPLSTLRQE